MGALTHQNQGLGEMKTDILTLKTSWILTWATVLIFAFFLYAPANAETASQTPDPLARIIKEKRTT